jgi:hypothetical protein
VIFLVCIVDCCILFEHPRRKLFYDWVGEVVGARRDSSSLSLRNIACIGIYPKINLLNRL